MYSFVKYFTNFLYQTKPTDTFLNEKFLKKCLILEVIFLKNCFLFVQNSNPSLVSKNKVGYGSLTILGHRFIS